MRTLTHGSTSTAARERRPGTRLFPLSSRTEALAAIALVLLYLAMMLPSLTRFPPVNNDEGREAQLSWVASGLQPGAERMNIYRGFPTWGTGGLQGATTVVLFWLFEFTTLPASLLYQARLTSLLWGGLLLLVVYWLGRHYWNRAVGLVASILLAVSNPFLLGTHTLRPDIQTITLMLSSLALVEYGWKSGRRWPPVLAGVLLGLSFDTHPNTVTLMPLIGVALLLRYGWHTWKEPFAWRVAGGLTLAAIYYLAVRVAPDPDGYLRGLQYWIGVDKRPPVARAAGVPLLDQLNLELLRYADYFGISSTGIEEGPELLLIILGLSLAVWRALRGSRPDRIFLLGMLGTGLLFVVAVSMKSRYYMLLSWPIYALLIARGLQQLAARVRRPLASRALLAVLVGLTVVFPLKLEDRVLDNYVRASGFKASQDYYHLTSQLRTLAGPGAKIMAPPLYWFGFHDHQFVDIFVYERVRRQYGESAGEFLESVRPDFVIADAKISTDKTFERELYRALDERAPYELIVRHKNFGDVAIYRLKWP